MRILITGGAGFIGSNLAHFYAERNFEVAVVDDFSTGQKSFLPPEISVFPHSILEREKMRKTFADFRPHLVSHHAAHVSVPESVLDPHFDATQNILGSIMVFQNAAQSGAQHVILASSGGAIGAKNPKKFPSPPPRTPNLANPYCISKFAAEKYLEFFAAKYGFLATIFRYANIYGPHQTPKSESGIVALLAQSVAKKQKFPKIFGTGNQTRDFLFVDDVCRAHFLASARKISGNFQLGSGVETSLLALFARAGKIAKRSEILQFAPPLFGETERSCLDFSAFAAQSGWAPEVDLDFGITKTFDWARGFWG